MPSLKLSYFDARGRGEPIRLLLKYAGIPFEDHRVTFDEWPALKEGGAFPYKQMPILVVDGKTTICQYSGLMRYVASLAGMIPSDPLHQAKADSLSFGLCDLVAAYYGIMFEQDPKTKEEKDSKFNKDTLPFNFGVFEKLLSQCGKFFGGDKMCYADIEFFDFINSNCMSGKATDEIPDNLKAFEGLQDLYKRIAADPKIHEYVKSRKESPF